MAIITVDRPIPATELGPTLPHEHIFCDTSPDYREPPAHIHDLMTAMDVDLGMCAGPHVAITWFEPATGQRRSGGSLLAGAHVTLVPPFAEDSALLLESVAD